MNGKWVGNDYFFGKWKVGYIAYDSFTSRKDENKMAARCHLPGIKAILGYHKTDEEAMAHVEKACNYWLKEAGHD